MLFSVIWKGREGITYLPEHNEHERGKEEPRPPEHDLLFSQVDI